MNWTRITPKKIKNRIKTEVSSRVDTYRYNKRQANGIENYKRVLHIWDTAGVASLLSRELNKHGYESHVIMRTIHDPFGMTKYYGQESVDLEGYPYLAYCKRQAQDYGIIHIHGIYKIVPEYKKIFPNKKIVLQFHGTELVKPNNEKELVECASHADAIICSTPDLEEHVLKHPELPKPYVCINPTDTELFKPMPEIKKKTEKALYIKIRYIDFPAVEKYLMKHCPWDIEVFDRDGGTVHGSKNMGLPFHKMPLLYNQYHKLVDVKIYPYLFGKPAQAWSKTGMEALACGLQVFNYKNEIKNELPKEFTPKYHCKSIIKIYENMINA